MSAFQKLEAERKSSEKVRCKLCGSILNLKKQQIKDFYDALLNKEISNATIAEVLEDWGIVTSISTISFHRNGLQGHARHVALIKKAAE